MTAYKNTKSTSKKSDGYVRLYQFLDEKKYILGSIVFIGLFVVFMFNSFAALEPVSSITVKSTTLDYSKSEEGSWKYTKSAKWISKGKARINIKLETTEMLKSDYTDVILVLDTSGSMLGDKLVQVQTDINNLINDTIPKGNKIALITFNDTATIINNFTDDALVLQEGINNLTASGETNYYQALVKVDEVLSTYTKEDNKNCVVLFLTDGLPTSETPSEVGEYKLLKEKYDYLDINGIQYELGDTVLTGIKNITDNQFIANTRNLSKFLYKAAVGTENYEELVLTDYVDTNYFNLDNITDITTSFGNTSIKDDKVAWNLDGLKSGVEVELTIDINLNNDLIGVGGVYPTHTKTDLSYKIATISATESTDKTTVLKDNYVVTYEPNTPTGCVVSGVPSSKVYSVFDTVRLDDSVPTCAGYQFKEWKIETDDVEKIGNNKFMMPESNVVVKAVWKKLNISKSMDGKISKVQTLYKLMADNSRGLDTDVNFKNTPTDANSGIYTIANTKDDKYPVHYYRGNIDNNNVLFAGFCWKMVRTTSTGGVKLIYNGVYDENNKCNNTGTASQIGKSAFNSNYSSPGDVGYMSGIRYAYGIYSPTTTINVLNNTSISANANYYYGDSITYSNGTYTLQNAEQKTWSDNYSTLKGYYTCRSTSTTCTTIYYIVATASGTQYTLTLSGGETDPTTQTITLGKGTTDNGDGTYSLTSVVTMKKIDWYTKYSIYNSYYICKDLTNTTCDGKYPITATLTYQITYERTFNFIYGNDVTWDGTKYTLIDTYTSRNTWSTDLTTVVKKYHYTCLNTIGECDQVYYIYYFAYHSRYFPYIYYLPFSSGKDIETAKVEMFQNLIDSTIKKTIDSWYQTNMTDYTGKLEDTIWCNDRTLHSGALVGKDTEGSGTPYFNVRYRTMEVESPSIECLNESRDGFTVSTASGGNGALNYPVGLLTADEVLLAGGSGSNSKYYLYTGVWYWTMSPAYFAYYGYGASNIPIDSDGQIWNYRVNNSSYGVRPSVSLAPGTRYIDGDGTADNPFVIGDE